jgi:hypothetical protein
LVEGFDVRSALIAALLLILGGIAFAAPRPKDTAKEPVYFPTVEGTTLVYKVGDREETEVVSKVEVKEGDKVVHISSIEAGVHKPLMVVRIGKDGLYLLEETGQKYDPPWCILKLPAKAGDKWTTNTTRPDIGNLASSETIKSVEELTVPAGKLEKTVVVESTSMVAGKTNTVSYWFSDGVGWAKISVAGQATKELKSVSVPKK